MDCSILRFLLLLLITPKLKAQQSYAENSALDCADSDDRGSLPTFLYTCNGEKKSCKAFLIFQSQPPYNSVSAISNLTASDPYELARINNISDHTLVLPQNKEVIVPVVCSCSGEYYEAKASYLIPSIDDTYYTIATDTYQSMSTCNALMHENNYSALILQPGFELQVPLRCACPTSNQTFNGTKFLLTYLVSWGDSVPVVSERFNVSAKSVAYANGFTEDDPLVYALTPILVPLSVEPSSSQTIIHNPPGPPPRLSLPVTPIHGNRRSKKAYVWIGIGILVLVLCLAIFGMFLYHQKRVSQNNIEGKKKWVLRESFFVTIAEEVDVGLKVFEYEELKGATEDFSNKNCLGGSVYRGFFDGKVLAIKQMSKDATEEVKLLKKINHFNLISLFGACEHCEDFYLVYEFMENGSLRDWLKNESCPEVPSWNHRVQIALDIADGLHYLHNFIYPAYVHRGISSTNVLLNEDLRAKIANFSLARSAEKEANRNSSTRYAQISKGYLAPEYIEHGLVTPAIDVYAFGVVLLELVTGKEAVFLQDGVEVLLSEAVFTTMGGGNAEAIFTLMGGGNAEAHPDRLIDPNLNAEHCMEFAVRMIKLSLACLAEESESRPRIHQVLSSLIKIQLDTEKAKYFYKTIV
ncbi:unnamed protein product [Prunus brigantina]